MKKKEIFPNKATKGLVFQEPLLFEISKKDRTTSISFDLEVPPEKIENLLPENFIRENIEDFPELSEIDVVRHYTRLAQNNFSIDLGFYPLGSCTMKYNPKINEFLANLENFKNLHPFDPIENCQGTLEIMYELEEYLKEISGMPYVTLQPAAGAHGELTGMLMIKAYHLHKKNFNKNIVLIPDSAHGTNPASSALCGFKVKQIKSNKDGLLDLDDLKKNLDENVAALMITNPNTLGLFEKNIYEISQLLHSYDALLYCDGANLNALLGYTKPGDMGVDVLHFNLHKTFSTPHGGGGPGSGPVGVSEKLEPFLPVPIIKKIENKYILDYDRPLSIGKISTFYGNVNVMIKAYCYIRKLSAEGLKKVAEIAVLNANYIRTKLKDFYYLPYPYLCKHEVVFSDKWLNKYGVKTLDIAKRLMDYGFHPPTVYFPLIVSGAIMIEPTETESKDTLDAFISAMINIAKEAESNPQLLHEAPHITKNTRLNEVLAARKLILRWQKNIPDL